MTADKLPPCPLCGCLPEPYGDGICVWCGGLDGESRSNACPLRREDSCFTPDEWRRLAAVDLRAEVERLTNAEQVDADTIRRLREALEHGVEHKRKAEARAEKAEREALINRVAVSDIAARAEKLAAALREIAFDWPDGKNRWADAAEIAARALAEGEGKE